MTIYEIIILALIGIASGLIAGSLGVGGGIILVPALAFFYGMTQHQAQGTSLTVLLFPVGLFAVLNYNKKGYINFKFVLVLSIAFLLGSYLGSMVAINLPDKVLKKIFGALMLIAGIKMILEK